ncbi:hypothetical protein AALP_AA8G086100 [Arabis alpina]|uniref:Bifunctional inhibitor/plant lipid transfer protein/seed storage helical domain-containing protein n=1 Tax=Arabis alpina TaxID=50452 RepID=A0A087G5T8_ARAAL|nr:hypothetical protein AALP_AA8G086100 [Arabis alpina]
MAVFSVVMSLLGLFLSISSPSYVHGNTAPTVDCSTVILNMASCLSFVTIGSTVEIPEASCCNGLKKVLQSSPACLCEGLKNSGLKLNVTKASTLPMVCKLNAPPMSACGLSTNTTTPTSAPAPVPVAGPRSGSASVPAPSPAQKNHGSSLIPISGWSIVFSGALVILFSRI